MFHKILFSVCLFLVSSSVYGAPRRSSNYHTIPRTQTYAYTSSIPNTNSDQERCQAEANYMAANNITGHVWGCIGRFEGVGYGSSPNCNTCTPSGNMSLTGDASAQGRNGMWYRVRSWR